MQVKIEAVESEDEFTKAGPPGTTLALVWWGSECRRCLNSTPDTMRCDSCDQSDDNPAVDAAAIVVSSIHYLKDIPRRAVLIDDADRVVVIERSTWDEIAAYNGCIPTAPSAGRVYRRQARTDEPRHASGPGGGDRNFLFIVRDDPADPKYQLHHPYEALVVEP